MVEANPPLSHPTPLPHYLCSPFHALGGRLARPRRVSVRTRLCLASRLKTQASCLTSLHSSSILLPSPIQLFSPSLPSSFSPSAERAEVELQILRDRSQVDDLSGEVEASLGTARRPRGDGLCCLFVVFLEFDLTFGGESNEANIAVVRQYMVAPGSVAYHHMRKMC